MYVHPNRTHATKLGCTGPGAAPPVNVREFVDIEKAQAYSVRVETLVDWSTLVRVWEAYLNTEIGCCTCSSAANGKKIATAAAGEPDTVTNYNVLCMYEHSGYEPGKPETDRGWTLEAAEEYMQTIGLQGTEANPDPDIITAATIDPDDEDALQVSCELFGGAHVAAEMPENAEMQYREGKAWTYKSGAGSAPGSWGGHALWVVRSVLKGFFELETWGMLQPVGPAWRKAYIVDKRALIWKDWEKKMPAEVVELGVVDFSKLESLLPQVSKA